MRSLRRTETGGLGLAQCVTLAQLEALEGDARLAHVLPADHLLQGHTPITLGAEDAARFLTGLRRRGSWADADAVAVYADQPRALLGVGHIHAGELIPDRLLSPLEIQQILEGMSRPS